MPQFSTQALDWLCLIFEERFGLALTLSENDQGLTLQRPGAEGHILFDILQPEFHQSRSDFPCGHWDAAAQGFSPVLKEPLPTPAMPEPPAQLVEEDEQGNARFHYDILGLTYWMLTRLEEIDRTDLDEHSRFPATSSHAYRHGYLERPVVDEWLIILGQVIQRVWPGIELKQHEFSMKVSHDVDVPSLCAFKSWPRIARIMAGHLLKRRDLKAFFTAPYVKLATLGQLHPADPCNTFEWLMDVSDANHLTSAFYFICGRTDPKRDADYEPEHPMIRQLIRRIHGRGHEIGLHPSFNTYQRPAQIAQEANRLRRIMTEEDITQAALGGRMHYLRWETPTTLNAWAQADMDYDSTLGYADRPGFRCGTCHEYPGFDAKAQKSLEIRVRPLVAMDCTVIAKRYLGLGSTEAAFERFNLLKSRCSNVNGTFTLLWHNSFFGSGRDFEIYLRLLSVEPCVINYPFSKYE